MNRSVLGHVLQDHVTDCNDCALADTRTQAVPFSAPSDYGKRGVVFVGEAPGSEEDKQGQPFIGPAGSLLRGVVRELGVDPDDMYYTNVVACRPGGNDFGKAIDAGAVSACRGHLNAAIVFSGAWLVVALGNNAYRSLAPVVEGTIGQVRGNPTVLPSTPPTRVLLPTWHPAYALRSPGARGGIINDLYPWLTPNSPRNSSDQFVKDMGEKGADMEMLVSFWYEARSFEREHMPGTFDPLPVQGKLL